MTVFISHSKHDRGAAREVAIFLAAENLSLRFDEWETAAGESIVPEASENLKGCSCFLLLWSKNAAGPDWIRPELRSALVRALADKWLKVIPLLLDDTPLPELLGEVRGLQFQSGGETERRELIRDVTGRNPSADLIREVVKKYHETARPRGGADPETKACPKCGSIRLEPWDDIQIEYEVSDGEARPRMWLVPAVRCGDCGWVRRTS